MIYTQEELLSLIHETRAVSIWDHTKGPVFWYAANVPGPFYVNTEMMIGAALSEKLLREITAIVAGTVDCEARAKQLDTLIMDAYKTSPSWKRTIATLIDRARTEFPKQDFAMISGGERRDWLFSIPFAHACEIPHLFLFKNQSAYCDHAVKPGERVLHVSDLINNAASFFDLWHPALEKLQLGCSGNVCVTVRGTQGLQRLKAAGQKVTSLVTVDVDFFRHLHAAELINRATCEEISIFFTSSKDWALKYLIGKPELFDVSKCDPKSFERLRFFVTNDPWKLRPSQESFFHSMEKAISARASKAA